MTYLTDTELAEIVRHRKERVEEAHIAYDWDKLTISDLAVIRAEAQEFVKLADEHLAKRVEFLRGGPGLSWVELGKVLGISKQAAQQRFGA